MAIAKLFHARRNLRTRRSRRNSTTRNTRLIGEPLEVRRLLTINNWIGGSGDWDAVTHWSLGHVPTATEDAVLPVGNYTVTHSQNVTDSVNSVTAAVPLTISAGSLQVVSTFQADSSLSLTGGTLKDATVNIGAGASAAFHPTFGILDGITVNGNWKLTDGNGLTVSRGLTLNGTLNLGDDSSFGALYFFGNQTLGGTGSVVFGGYHNGSSYSGLYAYSTGETLTIDNGVTVRGKLGIVGTNYPTQGVSLSNVINHGTIQADVAGGTITINCLTSANSGTLKALSGATLAVNGPLVNSNNIVVDATSTLYASGTISSGTITTQAGAQIYGSTLSGVTINGDWQLINGNSLTVSNGLTLNGTLSLGNDSSYSAIYFNGSQTLAGTGSVVFGGYHNGVSYSGLYENTDGAALTIGSGVTVRGKLGIVGTNSPYQGGLNPAVNNQGTIQADVAGGTITINGLAATNNGSLKALNGATLALNGSLTNASNISIDATSALIVSGTLANGVITTQAGAQIYGSTLSGVTINGDWQLINGNSLTVSNGLTLNGTLSLGNDSSYSAIYFNGSQTLAGTGSVVFGGFHNGVSYSGLYENTDGAALTIGSGVTIRGKLGLVGTNSPYQGGLNPSVNNQGTIQADVAGGTITINGQASTNNGSLKALNGATLSLQGTGWQDSGINFSDANSTFLIGASFLNTLNTLSLSGAGTFNYSGTIQGGTVSIAAGTVFSATGGALSGVTINGDWQVVNGNSVTVSNGLTLNGTLTLGNNVSYGSVYFGGSQILAGTGSVVFGSYRNGVSYSGLYETTDGATLTIGAGFTVHGKLGIVGTNYPYQGGLNPSVINQGTIQSDVNGGTITIYGQASTNSGNLKALNGAMLVLSGSLINASNINIDGTSTLNVGGTLTNGVITAQAGAQIYGGTLSGVTMNGDWQIINGNSLTVANGLTLNGTLSLGNDTSYGSLYFQGSQTLAGTGSVVFGGYHNGVNYSGLYENTDGAALTIGSGVTVRGKLGIVGSNYPYQGGLNATVVNQGTFQWANGGNIIIPTSLTNSGTILVDGASTMAPGGTIVGGAITTQSGASIASSTLNGVVVNGDWQIINGNSLTVTNGLTLNGTLSLGNDTSYGSLYFQGSQTLAGTGSVVFGGYHNGVNYSGLYENTDAAALTIGSGVTVRGKLGIVGSNYPYQGGLNVTVVNQGTFQWSNGGNIVIPTSLTNSGTILVDGVSTMAPGGTIIGGAITTQSGASIASSTLKGVVVNGDWQIINGNGLTVTNGLTLNGTLSLGNDSSYGSLYFQGSQTLAGTGSVIFGGYHNGVNYSGLYENTDAAALTIGSGVTVRGKLGIVGSNYPYQGGLNVNVVNQGVIQADNTGSTLTIYSGAGTVTNAGSISTTLGNVNVSAGGSGFSNSGTLSVGPTGTLNISGPFVQTSQGSLGVVLGGTAANQFGHVNLSGAATLAGTLAVSETNSFLPGAGNLFRILTFASSSGQFTNYSGLSLPGNIALQPGYNPADVTLTTVTSSTVAPDLRVGGVSIDTANPQSGQTLTLNWSDLNAGTGDTSAAWSDRVVIVNTTTNQTLLTADVPYVSATRGNLLAGSSANQSYSFSLPDGSSGVGAWQISITADYFNAIPEYYPGNVGESNNTTTQSFTSTLSTYPDLQVSGAQFTSANIQSGQSATVSWSDANTGTALTVGSWSDHVVVVNTTTGQTIASGDVLYDASANGAVASNGASTARFFTFQIPDGAAGVGQLSVTITTDSNHQMTEANASGTGESNNSATISAQSTLGAYPELSVTNVVVPASGLFNGTVPVTWTVSNSGNATLTAAISDRVYLSTDGTFDAGDRLLATIPAGASIPLSAGANYTQSTNVSLPLDASLPAGSYRILVVTDALQQQYELNENNNAATSAPISLTFPPLPDLMVTAISSVASVIAGQSIEVSWTIQNQGAGTATGTWNDAVMLTGAGGSGNGPSLGQFSYTGTLGPGETLTRTQVVTIPLSAVGSRNIVVTTDAGNSIFELSGESNNATTSAQALSIIAPNYPNLVVNSVSAPPTAFSSQSVTVNWTVHNIGSGSTNSAGWIDRVYLSLDSILDNNDVLLGAVQNPSYLNAGDSYSSTLTATLPQGTSGNYRFLVVTDAAGNVTEPGGETDNLAASSITAVTLTPPPDLVVSSVSAPTQVFSGQQLQVGWTVLNQGFGGTGAATWTDQVYVSFNGPQLDANSRLLATVTHNGALANGGSYSVAALNVTLPVGISGTAYFIVRTDSGNQVYENVFDSNNVSTAPAVSTVLLTPPPDLAVSNIGTANSAVVGQPLTVTYSVTNQGSTATPNNSWSDSIYLSADQTLSPGTDLLLGTRTRTGVLATGQSEALSYTFTLPSSLAGSYYLIVQSDSGNQVFELDKANNTAAGAVQFNVSQSRPDLVVHDATISGQSLAGQAISLAYSVTNSGQAPTPVNSWADSIYLSSDATYDATDVLLSKTVRTGILVSGQTESRATDVQLPLNLVGARYLIVITDSGNTVVESNEANNTVAIPLTISAGAPDLRVGSFSPRLGTNPVLVGSSLAFDYRIDNPGAGATSGASWVDRLVLSQDDIVGNADDILLGSYAEAGVLAAGASLTRSSMNFSIPLATPAGSYKLFLQTDSGNTFAESDETNNLSTGVPITISTTPIGGVGAADLQVSAVTAPATASSDATLSVAWTVANNGSVRTGATSWADTVWLSANGVIDANAIKLGSFTRSSPLDAGQSYSRTADFTLGIDLSGSYTVIVQTDAANAVFEGAAENNNTRSSAPATTITLSPTADLQVTNVSPPAQISSGRSFELSWTVANVGAGAASGAWTDSVYLSLDQVFDPLSDIYLGHSDHADGLNAGQQYSASASFNVPAALGGNYYVFVVADASNAVHERNAENNNINHAAQPVNIVHIPPADLVVGDITIPANSSPGQSATITFTINNNGQNPANGAWTDALYISSDGTWDAGDALFGRALHLGNVAAGGSYTTTLTANLPGLLPGNYKVIVRSDIRNNLVESNENNNLAASLDAFTVNVPSLALQVPSTGTLSNDGAVYYQVTVQTGDTLVIDLSAQGAAASTELYASFGTMPSRGEADFSAIAPYKQNQRIVVPVARGGTYYILAYGANLPANSPITITARTVGFGVLDTDFGQVGNAGSATLQITGAKFTGLTSAQLILGGTTISATNYWTTDSSTLYATFDLHGATLGKYDLRVSDPASGTVTVPAALSVVTGRGAQVTAGFAGASTVLINGTYSVDVQIGNSGDADGYAPLITVSSQRSGTPIGISPGSLSVQSYQFLGIKNTGPAGVYAPQESGTFHFFYRANSFNVAIDMGMITADDTTPIDWSSLKESLRPTTIAPEIWTPIFANITADMHTWGDYVVMLNKNATYLSQIGQHVSDVNTLWNFEVQQALNRFNPMRTLSSAVDLAEVTPGLSLGISRSFANGLEERNLSGMFGRGWNTTWDTYLTTETDGTVTIYDATGLLRQFTPAAGGGYTAISGDSGKLSFFNGQWQVQESSGVVTAFRGDGHIDFIRDSDGNRITATYSGGRLTRLTHSSGQYIDLAYNAGGKVAAVTDSAGRTSTYTYDATYTHLMSESSFDGTSSSYTYQTTGSADLVNTLLSVTTGGTTDFFTYDTLGRLASTFNTGGANLITYTYYPAGRVSVTDNLGTSNLYYDDRGLLVRVQDPLGHSTTATYGSDLRLAGITDALGQTQAFTWCDCGSLTSATDQLGHTTTFNYAWIGPNDTIRRMVSFTDANGNTTHYTYDSQGNRTSTIYADGSVEKTDAYDPAGNPLSFINRRGQVLSYQYNAAGQPTRQTFNDGTHIDMTYDAHGNLRTVTEPGNLVTTYDYDSGDRLTKVTYPGGRYLSFTYDAFGRRASMTDQTGYVVNYTYDTVGRLYRLTDGVGALIVQYSYDAGSRLSRQDNGNGTYTNTSYDVAGQVLSIANHAPGGAVNSRFDYTYDVLGRRVSMTTIDGAWTYGYDPTGQLTSAVFTPVSGSPVPAQNLQYVYDALGNRIRTIENGVTTNYTTNNLNQYTNVGGDTLVYDADGNLISRSGPSGDATYTYDQQNRLTRVVTPDGTWVYEYDAFGDRIASTYNGVKTEYVLDPTGLVNVVGQYTSAGDLAARYVYGLGLVSQQQGGGTSASSYYDFDAIGSTADITNAAGAVVNRYAYSPFGLHLQANEAILNEYQFMGQFGAVAQRNSLTNVRARYYSADLGRFDSIDPIQLASGDTNFYRAMSNSPSIQIDPSGLAACDADNGLWDRILAGIDRVGERSFIDKILPSAIGFISSRLGYLWLRQQPTVPGTPALGPYRQVFRPPWRSPFMRPGPGAIMAAEVGAVVLAVQTTGNFIDGFEGTPCDPLPPPPPPPVPPPPPPLPPWVPRIFSLRSGDPNDLLGPAGVGGEQWVSNSTPLEYLIHFENDPTLATGPAQVIRITETLDPDLDPRTFRLGTFALGNIIVDIPDNQAFYAARLDLRSTLGIYVDVAAGVDIATSTVFWQFTSIDPATGEVPLDKTIGLLPVNNNAPEGEGYAGYTVRVRQSAVTGDVIKAQATIVFDDNPAIDTPVVSNTLDATAPTSTMTTLPANEQDPRFRVGWSGADGVLGSGVSSYNIYVSVNGGPASLWLDHTTLTDAEYLGLLGSTYAFYSQAVDAVGNTENLHLLADATTTVSIGPQITSVLVKGSGWTPAFLNSLKATGHGNGHGYEIPVGSAAQLSDLAWTSINQIQIVFNQNTIISADSLVVTGLLVPQYGIAGFTYDPTSFTATWTLSRAIGMDQILLDLRSAGPAAVTDIFGHPVSNTWAQGIAHVPANGAAGGDFLFRFNVLPADANQDGIVNGQDIALVASQWMQPGVFNSDLNGDGLINGQDLAIVASSYGSVFRNITGDSNNDGIVNGQDIATVASNWLSHGPAGDVNNDGIVNGQDIALIASNWLATGTASSTTTAAAGVSVTALASQVATGAQQTALETAGPAIVATSSALGNAATESTALAWQTNEPAGRSRSASATRAEGTAFFNAGENAAAAATIATGSARHANEFLVATGPLPRPAGINDRVLAGTADDATEWRSTSLDDDLLLSLATAHRSKRRVIKSHS